MDYYALFGYDSSSDEPDEADLFDDDDESDESSSSDDMSSDGAEEYGDDNCLQRDDSLEANICRALNRNQLDKVEEILKTPGFDVNQQGYDAVEGFSHDPDYPDSDDDKRLFNKYCSKKLSAIAEPDYDDEEAFEDGYDDFENPVDVEVDALYSFMEKRDKQREKWKRNHQAKRQFAIGEEPSLPLLHVAISLGVLNVVELLLKHGADPNLVDNFGRSPFQVAEYQPTILPVLRAAGAHLPFSGRNEKSWLDADVDALFNSIKLSNNTPIAKVTKCSHDTSDNSMFCLTCHITFCLETDCVLAHSGHHFTPSEDLRVEHQASLAVCEQRLDALQKHFTNAAIFSRQMMGRRDDMVRSLQSVLSLVHARINRQQKAAMATLNHYGGQKIAQVDREQRRLNLLNTKALDWLRILQAAINDSSDHWFEAHLNDIFNAIAALAHFPLSPAYPFYNLTIVDMLPSYFSAIAYLD